MRMDDDELLTVKTCLGAQVKFLEMHPEVDLVGFCTLTAIRCMNPDEEVSRFTSFSMKGAPKPLLIPHCRLSSKTATCAILSGQRESYYPAGH